MILCHVTGHVKDQNWLAVGLTFVHKLPRGNENITELKDMHSHAGPWERELEFPA